MVVNSGQSSETEDNENYDNFVIPTHIGLRVDEQTKEYLEIIKPFLGHGKGKKYYHFTHAFKEALRMLSESLQIDK